jgi:hypothetical protein
MDDTSFRQASAKANERYRGKASARLYEDARVSVISSSTNLFESLAVTFGGLSAENAGVKLHIVHALSGVGSDWVVRESYVYENNNVISVK